MPTLVILITVLGIAFGVFIFILIKSIVNPKKVATLNELIGQGKSSQAVRVAKAMLAKDPRDTETHYLLGKAYLKDGKPELALMEFKTVNQIAAFGGYCKEKDFRRDIAQLYTQFGNHEEALKEYLLLIKLEPYEADHYYQAGFLFEERNNRDKAQAYYKKALENDPRHSDSHFRLGLILYKNNRTQEARAELETALKAQKDNYKAHFYMGRIYKDSNDYTSALREFEQAQKDPEHKVKALVERGSCFMNMKNYDRAVSELERAVKLTEDPVANETLYARYFLSICYEKNRSLDKAIEQWEAIYSKKPTFRDVAEKLSQYQDLRSDDRVKDYITSSNDHFVEICRQVVQQSMNLNPRDVEEIPSGCLIIAVESDSGKWRNTRKMPQMIKFLRIPEMVEEATLRGTQEEMKKQGLTRATVITSSSFSRSAQEFAENRPINLISKDQLQEILKKVDTLESSSRKR